MKTRSQLFAEARPAHDAKVPEADVVEFGPRTGGLPTSWSRALECGWLYEQERLSRFQERRGKKALADVGCGRRMPGIPLQVRVHHAIGRALGGNCLSASCKSRERNTSSTMS